MASRLQGSSDRCLFVQDLATGGRLVELTLEVGIERGELGGGKLVRQRREMWRHFFEICKVLTLARYSSAVLSSASSLGT
jgi:hypothetical protein